MGCGGALEKAVATIGSADAGFASIHLSRYVNPEMEKAQN
jgi:hypothetical protein